MDTVKLAIDSLRANRMRTNLTMLGIVIGVAALIAISMIGSTIRLTMDMLYDEMNTNQINAMLLSNNDEMVGMDNSILEQLSNGNMLQFEAKNPGIYFDFDFDGDANISINNKIVERYPITTSRYGIFKYKYQHLKIIAGRTLSHADFKGKKTCVIPDELAIRLFGSADNAVGKVLPIEYSLVISSQVYSVRNYDDIAVVGVYERDMVRGTEKIVSTQAIADDYGKMLGLDLGKICTQAELRYLSFWYDKSMESSEALSRVEDLLSTLQLRGGQWFDVYDYEEIASQSKNEITGITVAVSIIAAISLLVGGVGVMNIMLVCATERTREIGIQKALGAKNRDIRLQFLTESVIICIIGCFVGILVGSFLGSVFLIPTITNQAEVNISASLSLTSLIVSFISSISIGVFFGLYPANKAAKLNPIDALRYE